MTAPTLFPGHAVPRGTYRAKPIRRTSPLKLLAVLCTGIAVIADPGFARRWLFAQVDAPQAVERIAQWTRQDRNA